jgi:hypothetical protein
LSEWQAYKLGKKKKRKLLQLLLETVKETDRPCPFVLYCANYNYKPDHEPLGNACCWGGTGNRELFREKCIRQAAKYFWQEERRFAKEAKP